MNPEIGHQVFLKSIKNKKTVIIFNQNKAPLCIKVSHEFAQSWKLKNKPKSRKEIKHEIYKNGRYKHRNTTYLVG